jgi:F-type H+-transporting ATPase subunit gamma
MASKKITADMHYLYLGKPVSSGPIYVIFASDKGLCGSFNTKIKIKLRDIPNKSRVIVIGKKILNYAREREFEVLEFFPDIDRYDAYDMSFLIVNELAKYPIMAIEFVYMKFINPILQEPVIEKVFQEQGKLDTSIELEGEIDHKSVFLYFFSRLYSLLIENKTCENYFRMQAMESSIKNSKDLQNQLKLEYNKERQAVITREILEIVNGSAIT